MRRFLIESLARHWPFANGQGRIVDRLGGGVDLGSGERCVRTADGFAMQVLTDDHIGRHLILSGQFDRAGADVLADFGRPGDAIADVGANIGYVACLLLAKLPGSHVTCVEPQPEVAALLARNLEQFGKGRSRILRAALSDREGEGALAVDRANRGASALADSGLAIPLRRAAAFFGAMDRLDLLKMDIEGGEATVFADSTESLEALQPRAILYEDNRRLSGPGQPIGALLAGIGYRLYGLDKRLTRTALTPVTRENAGAFHDVLALSTRRELPQAACRKYAVAP